MIRPTIDRRTWLGAALALGAAWPARQVQACEIEADRLLITHPWARATAPGEDRAQVGMLLSRIVAPDRLIGLEAPVARGAVLVREGAEGPLDLPLTPGSTVRLSDGPLQVWLTGLRHPLHLGRDYPLHLHFEHSGTVFARLYVEVERGEDGPATLPDLARRLSPVRSSLPVSPPSTNQEFLR